MKQGEQPNHFHIGTRAARKDQAIAFHSAPMGRTVNPVLRGAGVPDYQFPEFFEISGHSATAMMGPKSMRKSLRFKSVE